MRYVIVVAWLVSISAWGGEGSVAPQKKGRFLASSPVITALKTPDETVKINQTKKIAVASKPSSFSIRACTEQLQTKEPFQPAPGSRCQ